MKVVSLIADIIKSKEINERESFQTNLESTLLTVSNQSKGIISPYTLTLGDEFQAVYKSANQILMDILYIATEIYPVKIRFALGVERLTTTINKKNAIGMDGPAFHIAREGIEKLKSEDYTLLQIYGRDKIKFDFTNTTLTLIFTTMDKWKKNTMEIFWALCKGKEVKDIVKLINISERGIYKIIDTNNLRNYVTYFKSLEKEIIRMTENEF